MMAVHDDPAGEARLTDELARSPALALVIEVLRDRPESYAIDGAAAGLEIVPQNQVKGAPNRCRLKFFRPVESRDRICAFFYKRSNLAWSRDRFSYGAVEFRPAELAPKAIHRWLAWLSSGFDPDARPDGLRRAFRYTVPE